VQQTRLEETQSAVKVQSRENWRKHHPREEIPEKISGTRKNDRFPLNSMSQMSAESAHLAQMIKDTDQTL